MQTEPSNEVAAIVDSLKGAIHEKVVVNWLWPAIIVGGAVVLGLVIERVILARLRKLADRTEWQGDEIIIDALRGIITTLLVIIGLFFASYSLPIHPSWLALLHKVLKVLLILCGTVALSRMAVGFARLSSVGAEGEIKSASILVYIARASVYLIGVLIILQSLGVSITPLLTALGVGGLAVALALQDTLSNLFAGIHVLASRKVRPGDYIRLETGQEGNVVDISWRTTTIKAPANHLIIVPNTRVASSIVLDFDQPDRETIVVIGLGVGYDSDLGKVERVTIDVAKAVLTEIDGGVPTFEPVVRFTEFGDYAIKFNVILRSRQFGDQFLLKHEFIRRIHERYCKEGIVIPYPVREIVTRGDKS
ncbi:mechanosensitive ion channel protein MscS [candidate division GN15 bacterium]|uniref:Mechanosensitive ion channel protein MscS n=1 Tax=candidate division GN15 bacterium TaxID=2072418 RepID=A0A855WVJ5_9BACT|nr:MAG: mechanosensitive ion channel protein MscS [candidate division GN15 bacterium]